MIADSTTLQKLIGYIRSASGYDLTGYAEPFLKRRINHFMGLHKMESIEKLYENLLMDETMLGKLMQEISITVTEMFRDPSFYKALRENVMKRLATYPFIRIWIAGCATGEEVYSIAIMLHEEGLLTRSVIYATDINQQSINVAKSGTYPISKMKAYTNNYQKSGGVEEFSTYYKTDHNTVMFNKPLIKNVVFGTHNLVTDKSFSEFQLILCRNVLIYFNQQLQNKVLDLFYESLCTFGYLALGSKESLLSSEKINCFEEVNKREKIFIKAR